MNNNHGLSKSPLFNVILFSSFWAVQVFVSKLAFIAGAAVMPFTVQYVALSLVLLASYILIFKRSELTHVPKTLVVGLLIASAIHGGLGGFLSNAGFSLTSAINAGFLLQFTTVTTSTLAWLVLKERMTASKAMTISIIMIGTFLLITKGHFNAPQVGDVLILLACASWSTGNVLIRRILKSNPIDSDVVTLFRPIGGLPLLLGFVALSPLYPQRVQPLFQANMFNPHYLGYAFLCAVFTVLLWVFLNRTLKIASASYMTMMSSLTPLLVAALALVFLHESLELIQWIGVVLIIGSSYTTHLLKIDRH